MFQFTRFPFCWLFIHRQMLKYCLKRVSPFGYLRISVCLRLPGAFRRWLRPSSALSAYGILHTPFVTWPILLTCIFCNVLRKYYYRSQIPLSIFHRFTSLVWLKTSMRCDVFYTPNFASFIVIYYESFINRSLIIIFNRQCFVNTVSFWFSLAGNIPRSGVSPFFYTRLFCCYPFFSHCAVFKVHIWGILPSKLNSKFAFVL